MILTIAIVASIAAISLAAAALTYRQKVQSAESRIERILASSREVLWEYNLHTGRMVWSDALEDLVGAPFNDREKSWERFQSFFLPEDLTQLLNLITEAKSSGRPFQRTLTLRHLSGSPLTIELRAMITFDRHQDPQFLTGTFSIPAAENQPLQDASKLNIESTPQVPITEATSFPQDVVHKLNNLLTGILGWAELTEKNCNDPVKLPKIAQSIQSSAQSARELIAQWRKTSASEFSPPPPVSDKVTAAEVGQNGVAPEQILVIDDEPLIVDLLQHMLTELGYSAHGMTSPSKALTELQTEDQKYKIVICDQNMPEMSGARFIELAAELDPTLRFILSSGLPENPYQEKNGNPPVGFIKKPFSVQQLKRAIEQLTQQPAHEAEPSAINY